MNWPSQLIIVRHGQSAGNIARDAAREAEADRIALTNRDAAVGGGAFVPGALRLTGEAALRAGAGKLRLATVEAAAIPLGVLVPDISRASCCRRCRRSSLG